MNSKLIDNVSVPKRSSRNSESHTKKVLGGNMRFCRNGTKNWLHCGGERDLDDSHQNEVMELVVKEVG